LGTHTHTPNVYQSPPFNIAITFLLFRFPNYSNYRHKATGWHQVTTNKTGWMVWGGGYSSFPHIFPSFLSFCFPLPNCLSKRSASNDCSPFTLFFFFFLIFYVLSGSQPVDRTVGLLGFLHRLGLYSSVHLLSFAGVTGMNGVLSIFFRECLLSG
jgi:hypothetical protein